jgi:exopolysaccharide biosynthesis predicted pyruvyltransferase EpsI
MKYTGESSSQMTKKVRISRLHGIIQNIFTIILTFPMIVFAQSSHEGHSMESHSLTHWLITIVLIAVIGWGIYKVVQRRKNS